MAGRPRAVKVEWGRRAEADLHLIWMYLADHSIDRADRIVARLLAAGSLLGSLPRLGRRDLDENTRLWSVPDIQYLLEYDLNEERVLILRVWSTRQDRERP